MAETPKFRTDNFVALRNLVNPYQCVVTPVPGEYSHKLSES